MLNICVTFLTFHTSTCVVLNLCLTQVDIFPIGDGYEKKFKKLR